jgi:hypothetical protein
MIYKNSKQTVLWAALRIFQQITYIHNEYGFEILIS